MTKKISKISTLSILFLVSSFACAESNDFSDVGNMSYLLNYDTAQKSFLEIFDFKSDFEKRENEQDFIVLDDGVGEKKCLDNTKNIEVNIKSGQFIESPLEISGNSNGVWFGFEGELGTVSLVDEKGYVLATGILKLEEDWIKEGAVEFTSEIHFDKKNHGNAKLIFKDNNPSDIEGKNKTFVVPVKINKTTPCTREYAPVCGKVDTGVRCITEPCPSFVEKTFSNLCVAKNASAEILYKGECTNNTILDDSNAVDNPVIIVKEKTEEEKKKEKKEKIVKEKTEEVFSPFDLFISKLENLVMKVENISEVEGSELWEKINNDLFIAKNKKAEARLIFSEISEKETREDIENNIDEAEKKLSESKNILKSAFGSIKEIISNLK